MQLNLEYVSENLWKDKINRCYNTQLPHLTQKVKVWFGNWVKFQLLGGISLRDTLATWFSGAVVPWETLWFCSFSAGAPGAAVQSTGLLGHSAKDRAQRQATDSATTLVTGATAMEAPRKLPYVQTCLKKAVVPSALITMLRLETSLSTLDADLKYKYEYNKYINLHTW